MAGARPAAARSGDTRAEERRLRSEVSRLERLLDRLARREADLHAELAAHASEHEVVLRLDAELRRLQADKAAAEEAWLRGRRAPGRPLRPAMRRLR